MAPVRDASKKRGEGGGRPQKLFGRGGEEGWEGELYEEEGGGEGNTSFPSLTTQKNSKIYTKAVLHFCYF